MNLYGASEDRLLLAEFYCHASRFVMGTLRIDANASLSFAYESPFDYLRHHLMSDIRDLTGVFGKESKFRPMCGYPLRISTSSAEYPWLPDALCTYHLRQETFRLGSRQEQDLRGIL